jgi:hypothetical protein
MKYAFFKQGDILIKQSKMFFLMLDDFPDKFYIILEGEVNIYIAHD